MIYGIIGGLFVGIIFTVFLFESLDKMDRFRTREWFKGAIIGGIILIGLCTYLFGSLGFEWETECKIDKTIKDTIMANYDNVTNYHNDYDNKSFFIDNSKYTFDYDEETKTLTVFTNTESSVDAVFVDGVKQTDQNISDNTDKKKDCISYQVNTEDNSVNKPSSTASSTTELLQKIQDKIQSRYNGAVLTSFDTVDLSGTFTCDDLQYSFSWEDDMLAIMNIDNQDDVTYYKIVEK